MLTTLLYSYKTNNNYINFTSFILNDFLAIYVVSFQSFSIQRCLRLHMLNVYFTIKRPLPPKKNRGKKIDNSHDYLSWGICWRGCLILHIVEAKYTQSSKLFFISKSMTTAQSALGNQTSVTWTCKAICGEDSNDISILLGRKIKPIS
jgi:hypothetical protein